MAPSPKADTKRRLVVETLRDQRADFENFVRARVAEQDVDDILQLVAERALRRRYLLRKCSKFKSEWNTYSASHVRPETCPNVDFGHVGSSDMRLPIGQELAFGLAGS